MGLEIFGKFRPHRDSIQLVTSRRTDCAVQSFVSLHRKRKNNIYAQYADSNVDMLGICTGCNVDWN